MRHDRSFTPRPDTWIVIPAYEEASTIADIVESVLRHVPDGHVLVVDDSSPDGTGELVAAAAKQDPRISLLTRASKEGLGPAYRSGLGHALASGARVVAHMDADFSHDPASLPALLDELDGADLVIGSRYVPGGVVSNWGIFRRMLSRAGSWYARVVLGVGVRDLTGGFKAFKAEVLEAIEIDRVKSIGYAFQIETTFRALSRGFRVREVPITFTERRAGSSKMTFRVILEAAWRVPAMRQTSKGGSRRS